MMKPSGSIIAISLLVLPLMGVAQRSGMETAKDEKPLHFHFRVYDSMTIRQNPTTQIAITIEEWPGNIFLLWLPESIVPVWNQWTTDVPAIQDFKEDRNGSLTWSYTRENVARLSVVLQPQDRILACIVQVKNLADTALHNVSAQNCFHLSQAPDFSCDDFSRIFIRTDGHWKSLEELHPDCGLPMYYRPGFIESGRKDSWNGIFREYNQPSRADHPLIMCVSNFLNRPKRTIWSTSNDSICLT